MKRRLSELSSLSQPYTTHAHAARSSLTGIPAAISPQSRSNKAIQKKRQTVRVDLVEGKIFWNKCSVWSVMVNRLFCVVCLETAIQRDVTWVKCESVTSQITLRRPTWWFWDRVCSAGSRGCRPDGGRWLLWSETQPFPVANRIYPGIVQRVKMHLWLQFLINQSFETRW